MRKPTVYLAGPIAGLTEGEAKDWRCRVTEALHAHGITGISPLRCEPSIKGRYDIPDGNQSADKCFGTAQAIGSKNEFDARSCDMILAYFPVTSDRAVPSVGTIIEIGWGKALNIPVVVVTKDPYLSKHPLIRHCSSWSLDSIDDAIDLFVGILGDYAK